MTTKQARALPRDANRIGPIAKPARARVGQRRIFIAAVVEEAERALLAAGVGTKLASARLHAGLSRRRLAVLAGCADTTIVRIEAGTRRPRASMLASIAAVLDPNGTAGLLDELTAAAGESLASETPGGTRRRRRRVQVASRQRRRAHQRARMLLQTASRVVEQADDEFTRAVLNGRGHSTLIRLMNKTHAAQHRARELRAEATVLLAHHPATPTKGAATAARALGQTQNARARALGRIEKTHLENP